MQRFMMCVVLVVPGMIAGTGSANEAVAQTVVSPSSRAGQVAAANDKAEARLQDAAKRWRAKFAAIGQRQRFRAMISRAISLEEKLGQGGDLFTKQREDRIRGYLRTQVVDERELVQAMAREFANLQQQLQAESLALYLQAGVDRKTAEKIFPGYHVETRPWIQAFDPLLARARSMARDDMWRFGAIAVGSSIVSDGLRDAGRQAGVYKAEKGSFADFLTGLAIELAAEAIADEVTDPTDAYATQLQASFLAAQRQVLEGPSGLLSCLRKITDLHQHTRRQHFQVK